VFNWRFNYFLWKINFAKKYQVPYLDQWSDVEGGHLSCLGGVSTALHNASLRLPVIGNVKVRFPLRFSSWHKLHQLVLYILLQKHLLKCLQSNCGEITEVLTSAVQLLEPLSPCVGNFLPKVRPYLEMCVCKSNVFPCYLRMLLNRWHLSIYLGCKKVKFPERLPT
jgi:hypothetical protein